MNYTKVERVYDGILCWTRRTEGSPSFGERDKPVRAQIQGWRRSKMRPLLRTEILLCFIFCCLCMCCWTCPLHPETPWTSGTMQTFAKKRRKGSRDLSIWEATYCMIVQSAKVFSAPSAPHPRPHYPSFSNGSVGQLETDIRYDDHMKTLKDPNLSSILEDQCLGVKEDYGGLIINTKV